MSEYGEAAIEDVITYAQQYGAYGADYIENILIQRTTPENKHPPVVLKKEPLNKLFLERPLMQDYDEIALIERRRNNGEAQGKDGEASTESHEK